MLLIIQRDNINALIDIKPEFANVKEGENIIQKTPENVKISDIILVKVGEKVPVDGILLSKKCSFDTAVQLQVNLNLKPSMKMKNLSVVISIYQMLHI